MKGLIGYSKRSELDPMGSHGSFRDLRQEEDPRLIGMVYSKDPGCQNSQIPTFSSSNQKSNAG